MDRVRESVGYGQKLRRVMTRSTKDSKDYSLNPLKTMYITIDLDIFLKTRSGVTTVIPLVRFGTVRYLS